MAINIVELFPFKKKKKKEKISLLRFMILCVLENETGNYGMLDCVFLCLLYQYKLVSYKKYARGIYGQC
jgi:hypothetical protein